MHVCTKVHTDKENVDNDLISGKTFIWVRNEVCKETRIQNVLILLAFADILTFNRNGSCPR